MQISNKISLINLISVIFSFIDAYSNFQKNSTYDQPFKTEISY